jgi:hypothetical protein
VAVSGSGGGMVVVDGQEGIYAGSDDAGDFIASLSLAEKLSKNLGCGRKGKLATEKEVLLDAKSGMT